MPQVYDIDQSPPKFLQSFGREGRNAGEFHEPCDVAVSCGRLLVSEDRRVQVLSLEGAPQQVLDMPGTNSLLGVSTLSATGRRVFVLDALQRRIHVLLADREGTSDAAACRLRGGDGFLAISANERDAPITMI